MVRVICGVVVVQVAIHTGASGHLEAGAMARCAIQGSVHAGQSEPGEFRVVELGAKPPVHAVTLLTDGWKFRSLVIRESRLHKVLHMAGDTLGRQSRELAGRRTLVAIVTEQGGMCPYQRETVVVSSHGLYRGLPSLDRVAVFASSPKLAAMDVRVAVGALSADIGKHKTDVALGARNTGVHASERVAGLVVIEFDDVTEGLPGCKGMAVVARDVQVTVRTTSGRSAGVLAREDTPRSRKHETQKGAHRDSGIHVFLA